MPVRGYPTVNGQLGGRSRPRGPGGAVAPAHTSSQRAALCINCSARIYTCGSNAAAYMCIEVVAACGQVWPPRTWKNWPRPELPVWRAPARQPIIGITLQTALLTAYTPRTHCYCAGVSCTPLKMVRSCLCINFPLHLPRFCSPVEAMERVMCGFQHGYWRRTRPDAARLQREKQRAGVTRRSG